MVYARLVDRTDVYVAAQFQSLLQIINREVFIQLPIQRDDFGSRLFVHCCSSYDVVIG